MRLRGWIEFGYGLRGQGFRSFEVYFACMGMTTDQHRGRKEKKKDDDDEELEESEEGPDEEYYDYDYS